VYYGEWLHGTMRKAENNMKMDIKIIILEITTSVKMT